MSPRAKRKRKILEAAEDNAYSHGPMEGVVIGEVAQEGESDAMQEDNSEEDDIPSVASIKSRPSRTLATPKRARPADAGKENETPTSMSTGGRSAKTKAMDRLSLIAPDIALYEKEKKRNMKPGTPFGGKHATKLTEEDVKKKKSASHKDVDDDEDRPAKKSRPSLPGVEMRIILTGFTRWVGSQIKEDQDRVSSDCFASLCLNLFSLSLAFYPSF
jgi:hypothetical protein